MNQKEIIKEIKIIIQSCHILGYSKDKIERDLVYLLNIMKHGDTK